MKQNNEIKLPAHLQAIVDNPKTQQIWAKFQEEKAVKSNFIIEDVTPEGYGN